jgi:uncharacterized delta-60 repeat protein
LDPTFGTGGIQTIAPGTAGDAAQDVIALADGNLLVCGYSRQGNIDAPFVTRLLPDGTLDGSFGIVYLANGSGGRGFAMGLAADSSMYVCGYVDTDGYEAFALWHLLADGTPDALFGVDGLVTMQIGFNDARAQDMVVQPDGKIVLAGHESSGSLRDGVFVRYNPDASVDSTFNGDGILVMATYASLDELNAVDLLDDGSIIAGGYADLIRRLHRKAERCGDPGCWFRWRWLHERGCERR